MTVTKIKVGNFYETKYGIGKCVRSGGTFPPSVAIEIVYPFPRGKLNFAPRDVYREVAAPPAPVEGK